MRQPLPKKNFVSQFLRDIERFTKQTPTEFDTYVVSVAIGSILIMIIVQLTFFIAILRYFVRPRCSFVKAQN